MISYHWRNESEWAQWEDRLINGMLYSFTHLRSFDMLVNKPAKGDLAALNVKVRVVFDCHVVTTAATYIPEDIRFWKDTGGNGRLFNDIRYQYSLNLPGLLEQLPTGVVKCYEGRHIESYDNYMVWEPVNPSIKGHYQAYFDIYRPRIQPPGGVPLLIMYVQSAYLKDEPYAKQREKHKAFGQLCGELLGLIPSKAERNKAKRKKKKQ